MTNNATGPKPTLGQLREAFAKVARLEAQTSGRRFADVYAEMTKDSKLLAAAREQEHAASSFQRGIVERRVEARS